MAQSNTITVGHIPSLTWNQLKMNGATLAEPIIVSETVRTTFKDLPAGITHKKLTALQSAKWLEQNAPGEEAEKFVAGKVPIYHPQKFGTGLGHEFDQALTEAKVRADLFEVEENAQIATPLAWSYDIPDGCHTAGAQIIHVKENAALTILMDYSSEKAAAGLFAVSTKVVLERGAKLNLVKAQTLGDGFTHLDDLGVSMADDASFSLTQVELGAAKSYVGIQVEEIGRKTDFQGAMGYLGINDRLIDINYNVVQRGKKTNSNMTFDGVLADRAEKSFRGTIDFRNGSIGSVGDEQENVLLLDPEIVNKTLPVILCEEEDVEGRHGATVGRLAEDMLFYMASRGIDEKQAEKIMVRARLGAVIRRIPGKELRDRLKNYVEEAFTDESLS